jgi:hypothetical protein
MERRREARIPASGALELEIEKEGRRVAGALVDISNSGFRVSHHDLSLRTGMRVRYSHPGGQGVAVVAWTRVVGNDVESGFYISAG